MSKYPVKHKARPVRTIEGDVVEQDSSVDRRARAEPRTSIASKGGGFSFRYSYAEFSAVGKSARFKTKQATYENGKFSAESFEGELDPKSYEHAMEGVQRFFADQTALYLRAFRSLLPPFGRGGDRE